MLGAMPRGGVAACEKNAHPPRIIGRPRSHNIELWGAGGQLDMQFCFPDGRFFRRHRYCYYYYYYYNYYDYYYYDNNNNYYDYYYYNNYYYYYHNNNYYYNDHCCY